MIRKLTPEETAKMRRVYARLAHGYDVAASGSPRTPKEQASLDDFATLCGQEYIDKNGELILMQARAFGDL